MGQIRAQKHAAARSQSSCVTRQHSSTHGEFLNATLMVHLLTVSGTEIVEHHGGNWPWGTISATHAQSGSHSIQLEYRGRGGI